MSQRDSVSQFLGYTPIAMMKTVPSIVESREIVRLSNCLLRSHQLLVGEPLMQDQGDELANSRAIFLLPMVVLAHGMQPDPILCYGNQAGLKLWEMSWEELTCTPSRLTAEPGAREDRDRLLAEARSQGFSKNYRGVRISASGRRFWIENVTVWNVLDEQGNQIGQAAAFADWRFIESR